MVNASEFDYNKTADKLREMGLYQNDNRVRIAVKSAGSILMNGIRWAVGDSARWLQEYDLVVSWLSNNEGRGLLMYGNCGRGKTLIGRRLLPIILNHFCKKIVKCYTAQEMNRHPDEVLSNHVTYLDDIGTEDVCNIYGNKRLIFPEIVDAAERDGKLLIISTNLTLKQLEEKYGIRTKDRLRAITVQVPFKGESLRK
jgi:DNA replication protein DnaC